MAMTDQERGMLLVEQEKLTKKIADLRSSLTMRGGLLNEFGKKLTAAAERITFANAPAPLGNHPAMLSREPVADWDQMKYAFDLTAIAQAVQDLREAEEQLVSVKGKLAHG